MPESMAELVALPGVGRKTANVVLGNAFGPQRGDRRRHPRRAPRAPARPREADDPVAIERELVPLFPQARWADLAHLLIAHGRAVCKAPRPRCARCVLAPLCPSAES